jgi:hypothetical protein
MNIRRGLIRIWVVLTALLLTPLGITTYQNWVRAGHVYEVEIEKHRFEVSGTIMEGLPELERNQVINRIAWLKGIHPGKAPAVKAGTGMFDDLIAEAQQEWQQPLSPKLEALAQGQQTNLLPSWEETWPFLAVIAILWAALYTGFWIVSGFQSRPAR